MFYPKRVSNMFITDQNLGKAWNFHLKFFWGIYGLKNPSPLPLQIKGQQVEIVHQYEYLGTILKDKLDWTENWTMLLKKVNQRLYFLKSLKSFRVKPDLLKANQATIESIVRYDSLRFYDSLRIVDAAKLRRVEKTVQAG